VCVPVTAVASVATSGTPLAERVYEALIARLLSRQLRPGQHLNESQLAESLKCSRTPLRAALARLTSEGIAQQRSHRGCFVTNPTVDDLRQLYAVRAAFEPLAAGLMARNATGDDLRALGRVCGDMRRSRESGDTVGYLRNDFLFHQRVVRSCGNRYLAVGGHAEALVILSFMAPGVDRDDGEDISWPGHTTVYQAMLAGEPADAEAAMRQHIEISGEMLQERLKTL